MTGQPSLFDPVEDVPHARATDPGTSWAAARATEAEEGTTSVLRPGSAKHEALKQLSRFAQTAIEVERACGRRGLWKRVSDLKNAGLIDATGTRRDPQTHREGIVWALNGRGWLALSVLDAGKPIRL